MKNPKIKFSVPSYEGVARSLFSLINNLKEDYRNNIYMELPYNLYKDIIENDFQYVKERLIEEIKKEHDIEKLKKFKRELEIYWGPLNDVFFRNLKEITGFDFEFNEYIVYITEIIRGMYTTKNEVFTNLSKDIKRSGYITAEEILHLHYWDIFKRVIKNVKMPWRISKEIWMISEIIPEFVLTDDSFEKFGWGKNLNRRYPFINEMKSKLSPVWKDKKDFKDFIEKAHENLNFY
tara:strand:- start:113 stop:817 length:705 start_codon:yes stop_codon:yes gene_type:complete